MHEPKITIVTPSFQQGQFLEATMLSVLNQPCPSLEYMVIDGGSTDGSAEIIRRHADKLAYWCSESDEGQTAAINKGLRRATGDIVGWVNSDDVLLEGALAKVTAAFEDPTVQAVCGWVVSIDENGTAISRRVYPQPTRDVLLCRSLLPQPAVFWRRELFQQVGFLDESFHICMDLDFWVRLVGYGVVPKLIPSFLAGFRRHSEQKTDARSEKWQTEELSIWRRIHGPSADRKRLRKSIPLGWRIRYSLMKRAMKLGFFK
ncbi:MAG: glycosyltransferase [Phycisphaerae bacterium]|nr:glycosyltransferase [Phycisphaerae bacterium]